MPSDAENRLANLIKRLKPSDDLAAFRNDYRAALSRPETVSALGRPGIDAMQKAREHLESWVSSDAPNPSEAFTQWRQLYTLAQNRLPWSLLESLLKRLPAGTLDKPLAEETILNSADLATLSVLVGRKLITDTDLVAAAENDPASFYASAGFDLLVTRPAIRNLVGLWEYASQAGNRPSPLMPRSEAIARWYATTRSDAWDKRMISLLATAIDRPQIVKHLIPMRTAVIRLYEKLERTILDETEASSTSVDLSGIAATLIAQCEQDLLQPLDGRTETASLLLARIRMLLLAHESVTLPPALAAPAAQATDVAALRVLRTSEGSDVGAYYLIHGDQLHRLLQEYVRRLPVGNATESSSVPDQAARLERHRGSKELVEQVLDAMSDSYSDQELRDALEVALFNSGVRTLGTPGEIVPFDVHAHQSLASGVLPGENVAIDQGGKQLGSGPSAIVLVKAKVSPVSSGATSRKQELP